MCRSRTPARRWRAARRRRDACSPKAAAQQPLVLIDYAHTPDALAKALHAARAHCRGTLWCVFGCGGERDRGQARRDGAHRRAAGAISSSSPMTIRGARIRAEIVAAIMQGVIAAGAGWRARASIHDRGAGDPQRASRSASPDDVVLVAGKGHEDYQIVGSRAPRLQRRRRWCAQVLAERGAAVIRTPAAICRRRSRPPARRGPRLQRGRDRHPQACRG